MYLDTLNSLLGMYLFLVRKWCQSDKEAEDYLISTLKLSSDKMSRVFYSSSMPIRIHFHRHPTALAHGSYSSRPRGN